ncbi:hypothetical protein FSARC_9474 [Fusarium sarcochroum]|uniref:Uncharacterized protein n=1 Tax=Fusarium sarcochroum TaxID=1208366 RepID=A0A8H4TQW8_9HYPO|nr:hypothetical protein FSARC_9474 [Fusarium sarcochroum]
MDCFATLPPEIRAVILAQFSSATTISRLIRASPAMLAEYTASKTGIIPDSLANLLCGDQYHDILQDALAIIHLDLTSTSPDNHLIAYRVEQWAKKKSPNPFRQDDQVTVINLYWLFTRLGAFVEDYLSKATTSCPAQAYLHLPKIAHPSSGLHYKQNPGFKHVTLDDITCTERHRLLRAFTKYEVLCKIHDPRVEGIINHDQHATLTGGSLSSLDEWEKESLRCVNEYVRGVYGGLFAMCAAPRALLDTSSMTPQLKKRRKRLYPDNLYFDAQEYLTDMSLSIAWRQVNLADGLPYLGFDLLTHLLVHSDQNRHTDMRGWLRSVTREWRIQNWPRSYHSLRDLLRERLLIFAMPDDLNGRSNTRWMNPDTFLQRKIYRQRAWVFFDDARLFPDGGNLNHFPTMDDLEEEFEAAPMNYDYRHYCEKRQMSRMIQLSRFA